MIERFEVFVRKDFSSRKVVVIHIFQLPEYREKLLLQELVVEQDVGSLEVRVLTN